MKNPEFRRPGRRVVAAVLVLLVTPLLSGCASLGVKPWDRDLLATKAMALNTHPHVTAADDHIYFSKEGSTGGRGFEGGGCGCN